MTGLEKFKLHHVGCAVESINDSLRTYIDNLGFDHVSRVYKLDELGIKVCFVEISKDVHIELIEPMDKNSVINTLRKKGVTYYHLGYKVTDINKVEASLLDKGFKEINSFFSPAFNNRKCIFMYTPEQQMIELIDSD